MTLKATLQKAAEGLTFLGSSVLIQSLLYPWRRAYHIARLHSRGRSVGAFLQAWRAARRHQPPAWNRPWTFIGDLVSCSRDGRQVTLQCVNAAMQLTVLAPDLVRIRLSPTGEFPAPFSYAVARKDDDWPAARFTLEERPDCFLLRTGKLLVRITRHPCRLTFLDPNGQEIQADAGGLGWSGAAVMISKGLSPDEHIYGLGEKAFGLDRRGHAFEMWNTDPQPYPPGRDPLYLNIPFYLGLHGALGYGLFFDNSYRAHFDLGATRPDELRLAAAGGELRYYFFYGPNLSTVLERYTELTGRMPLPPLWALGNHQSRWSYYPEARVQEIAKGFRVRGIPCDAIHLDIHYMRGYRCFTWDRRRFPDPQRMTAELGSQGFKTVVILDPAIKADRSYPVCATGLEKDAFLRYPDGALFSGPVWPGKAYFPDFTAPAARRWWADLCHMLLAESGVAGIWTDMNEPAVFGGKVTETIPDEVLHCLEGQGGNHAQAHNVYGMQMARATREGWQAWRPDERPYVITRSGFAGAQRYAAHWTGDNQSTWEHLQLTIPMILGLGLSGLALTGCDTGGFVGECDGEMLVRWTQLCALTPYCRNHKALGMHPQEPWAYGEPYESHIREAIVLRYRLLPYLYTAFWQCAERGLPMMRPLCLAYQADHETHTLDDQFLLGDALLVAPVCTPGASTRPVYLPAGTWFRFGQDKRYRGPTTVTADAPLAELPLFVRAGSVLPMWPPMQYVGERPVDVLTLHVFPGTGVSWLYEDDGCSLQYQQGQRRVTRFSLSQAPGSLKLRRESEGSFLPAYTRYRVVLHGVEDRPKQVLADGAPVAGWAFDAKTMTVEFTLGDFQRLAISC